MSPQHQLTKMSGAETWSQPGHTLLKYQIDWRDHIRHIANVCFVLSYVCLTNGMLFVGSLFTVAGESLLAPSAFKQRSWSTLLVGGVFLFLALSTIARVLLS